MLRIHSTVREQLSRREPRDMARPRDNGAPVRPITSFHADSRYGGDLHRAREPSLWRTRYERRAKNECLHYLRTKSSTNPKLDEVPSLGRLCQLPLELLWRILARRQRTAGREGRVKSEQQREPDSLNDAPNL